MVLKITNLHILRYLPTCWLYLLECYTIDNQRCTHTASKCLDEGVDVPRSELAIFCASTGNPRQFIQRRGRILRTHKDKHIAIIHDLVVAPEVSSESESYSMERRLLENELKRVRNFSLLSENSDDTLKELDDITSYYNLSLF